MIRSEKDHFRATIVPSLRALSMVRQSAGKESTMLLRGRLYTVLSTLAELVGGAGFEPGPHGPEVNASRSSHAVFKGFQFESSDVADRPRPDLRRFADGLLHALLHRLSTEVDGSTLPCAPLPVAELVC